MTTSNNTNYSKDARIRLFKAYSSIETSYRIVHVYLLICALWYLQEVLIGVRLKTLGAHHLLPNEPIVCWSLSEVNFGCLRGKWCGPQHEGTKTDGESNGGIVGTFLLGAQFVWFVIVHRIAPNTHSISWWSSCFDTKMILLGGFGLASIILFVRWEVINEWDLKNILMN